MSSRNSPQNNTCSLLQSTIILIPDDHHSMLISEKINLETSKAQTMIGHMLRTEIEELLHAQMIGRLACYDNDHLYIVPISYAYDDNYIYCHSYEGKKLQMMRRNPGVCFQVDEMRDMANWKSVIAWGDYEELLEEDERNKALHILLKRRVPISSSITTHLGESWPFTAKDDEVSDIPGVVFRIALTKKSGKYEKTSETPAIMYG